MGCYRHVSHGEGELCGGWSGIKLCTVIRTECIAKPQYMSGAVKSSTQRAEERRCKSIVFGVLRKDETRAAAVDLDGSDKVPESDITIRGMGAGEETYCVTDYANLPCHLSIDHATTP